MARRRLHIDKYTTAGLAAIALWSVTPALSRSLSEQLGALRGAAAVYLFAGAICVVYMSASPRVVRELKRLPRNYLLACGPLFAFYMIVYFVAIGLATDRQQAVEVSLVNYLWCPLTLLFSIPLLNKRASWLIAPGLLLVLAGLFLVVMQEGATSLSSMLSNTLENPLPYVMAVAVAIAWALYSNLTRRLAGAEATGGVLLFLPATGALLLALSLLNPEPGAWSAKAAFEVAGLGGATAGGYFLWDIAMRKGDLVFVATCSYLVPLLATVISRHYLAVPLGAPLWLGSVLIVVGSLSSWRAVSE